MEGLENLHWQTIAEQQLTFCNGRSAHDWLFWVSRPFETVFQSILGRLPKKGRKRRGRIDESKNVQTNPTRTYYKSRRPLPYFNPNCRPPRQWKFTQHHRTTRPPHHPTTPSAHEKEALRMRQACVNVPCRPLAKYLYSGITYHWYLGWLGSAMVLGKLPVPERPSNLAD